MSQTTLFTSSQAAAVIGVHLRTLYEWLATGKLEEPRRILRGKVPTRLFSERDLQRARELKARNLPFRGR